MGDLFTALKDTPLPVILAVGGILFLLLGVAGNIKPLRIGPLTPAARGWAAGIGVVLLAAGIILYVTPVQQPGVNTTPAITEKPLVAETPTDAAASPPADTSVPTDGITEPPTEVPTPEPKARITNLEDGTLVTQFIDLIGEYRADVTDDIWVFVHDPGGTFFAASMAPCEGQSAVKSDGTWEIYVGVGIEASEGPFELVVTVAPPDASKFIADTLKKQCKDQNFPGFPSLPPGVEEVQRITVQRHPSTGPEDMYPAPPALSDAGLPGQISVAAFGSDGKVGQEEIISGAVSGTSYSVWALVYTFYGRWYPQSFDACRSQHTEVIDNEHWRAKAIFGGGEDSGKPFHFLVVLADAEANSTLAKMQKEFCEANHYPGFLTIELPDGLSQKYSTRVIRR